MDPLLAAAASGMRARMESLDLLANNLANTATAGYKLDREFYSLYAAPEASDASRLPLIEKHWTDFSQGTLTPTGNPLDLALATKGFFEVRGPNGPLYTRNGAFRLSATGVLTTSEGYAVAAAGGGQIQAQGQGPLEIAPDGTVRQDGAILGRLNVVEFTSQAGVIKQGRSYFRIGSSAPVPAAAVEVHQGKLEASNVSAPEAAVRLVNLMRQFEMLQRAVSLGGEMGRRAVEEVAKVNP